MSAKQAQERIDTVWICPYTGKAFTSRRDLQNNITSSNEGPLAGMMGLSIDREPIQVDVSNIDLPDEYTLVDLELTEDELADIKTGDITPEQVISELGSAGTTEPEVEVDDEPEETTQEPSEEDEESEVQEETEADDEESEVQEETEADDEESEAEERDEPLKQVSGEKKQNVIRHALLNPDWDYIDVADAADCTASYAESCMEEMVDGEWHPSALSLFIKELNANEIREKLETGDHASLEKRDRPDEEKEETMAESVTIRGEKKIEVLTVALENPKMDYEDVANAVAEKMGGCSNSYARNLIVDLEDGEFPASVLAGALPDISLSEDEIAERLETGNFASSTLISDEEAEEEQVTWQDEGAGVTEEAEPEPEPEPETKAESEPEPETKAESEPEPATVIASSGVEDAEEIEGDAIKQLEAEFRSVLEQTEYEIEHLSNNDFAHGKRLMAERGLEILGLEA